MPNARMTRRAKTVGAVLGAALLVTCWCIYWVNVDSVHNALSDENAEATATTSANAYLGGTSTDAEKLSSADGAQGSQTQAKSTSNTIFEQYIFRRNFRALVQKALGSRDQREIDYAYTYAQRCAQTHLKANDATAENGRSAGISKAIESFNSFCSDLQGKADRQMIGALAYTKRQTSNPTSPVVVGSITDISGALRNRDVEFAIEGIVALPAAIIKDYLKSIDAWEGDFDALPPEVLGNYLHISFKSELCKKMNCDSGYWMLFNCEYFGECSQSTLAEQEGSLYSKLWNGAGAATMPSSSSEDLAYRFKRSASRAIDLLATQS